MRPQNRRDAPLEPDGTPKRVAARGLAAVALAALVCVVFFPVVGFEFVDYDVGVQVLNNPHIRGLRPDNLKEIFTSRSATSYYPVRTLTFALDYRLWRGLKPGGFKLTNGLIHLTNVLLVFWLILRLLGQPDATAPSSETWRDVALAAFAAGVFAVHPVVVEPVAWVGGREELLMTLGALGCIHFHLSARRWGTVGGKPRRALACHVGAALCCGVACLSNAVGAVIPLLIVAWDALTLARPRLPGTAQKTTSASSRAGCPDAAKRVPAEAQAVFPSVVKIVRGTAALWLIAAATVVLKKWEARPERLSDTIGVFSADRLMLVLKVYWMNLQTLVRPTQLAIEYPNVTLRGFADAEVMLGAAAAALTCGLMWLVRRQKLILFGLVWFVLALGPTSQVMPHHIPRADRFLYLPLVGLSASLALGLGWLGGALRGRVVAVVIAALGVLSLLGILSAGQVQTWRNSLAMWENCLRVDPHNALAHGGVADNLASAGQFDEAIRHYRIAVSRDPDNSDTLRNFALLLATCPQKQLRNYALAEVLAERACRVMEPPEAACVMALAEVYAQTGRSELAVATTEKAIQVAEAAGNPALADQLRRRLKRYRDQGRPRNDTLFKK